MIILLYIIVPAVAAPVAWLVARRSQTAARWIAVAATAAPLALLAWQWAAQAGTLGAAFAAQGPGAAGLVQGAWLEHLQATWISALGISFFLAEDGLTVIMLLLTFALGLLAVLASWRGITKRVGLFHFTLLWTVAALSGVFLSLDLFLFYFFFEMMLIPMYFVIALWGHERRVYAAVKFFIFTQASGLLMLLAILALYFIHGRETGVYTFDYVAARQSLSVTPEAARWLFWAFALAFAVKVPMFPVHTWLPDAHTEAPTAGSVILAGVLLKMGTFGFFRYALPLFPEAALEYRGFLAALAVVGIIYGALMSFVQTDMKRLVAYSSVSHLGFVMLGMMAITAEGLTGSVYQMLNHGVSTGGLFLLVGMLYERRHTRLISEYGGLAKQVPWLATAFVIVTLSSVGLPGTNGFVGEFLILSGTWLSRLRAAGWYAALGATGVVLGAVYMLVLVQRVFFGKLENPENRHLPDLSLREVLVLLPVVVLIGVMGILPQPFLQPARPAVDRLLGRMQAAEQRMRRADPGLRPLTGTEPPALALARPPAAPPAAAEPAPNPAPGSH